jgi:predicted SprT family Zn-dependent metalloprotease
MVVTRKQFATTRFFKLCIEHNIKAKFKFNKNKSRAGICFNNPTEIQLSEYFVNSPGVSEEKISDVILHELAHAIAGVEHMHDDIWVGVAESIGCTSDVCAGPFLLKRDYNYSLTCASGCDIRKLRLSKKYLARPHICSEHKKIITIRKLPH